VTPSQQCALFRQRNRYSTPQSGDVAVSLPIPGLTKFQPEAIFEPGRPLDIAQRPFYFGRRSSMRPRPRGCLLTYVVFRT
jgi:hypothetical protein